MRSASAIVAMKGKDACETTVSKVQQLNHLIQYTPAQGRKAGQVAVFGSQEAGREHATAVQKGAVLEFACLLETNEKLVSGRRMRQSVSAIRKYEARTL